MNAPLPPLPKGDDGSANRYPSRVPEAQSSVCCPEGDPLCACNRPSHTEPVTDNSPYSAFVRRILKAYRRRVIECGDPEDLKALAALSAEVERTLGDAVSLMRADFGYSWTDVGRALGISRQGAQQRFSGRS